MACCSHRPIAGARVDDRFAGGTGVGRGDVLPLSPRTVSPSLELTSGRERACSVPSVRRCHIRLLWPLPEPMPWQGRMVLSAHAGLPQANDTL